MEIYNPFPVIRLTVFPTSLVFSSTVPSGSGDFQCRIVRRRRRSAAAATLRRGRANLRKASVIFLAPPAEWQRSFSNAELSVVRRRPSSSVNFSHKSLISQKLFNNVFCLILH